MATVAKPTQGRSNYGVEIKLARNTGVVWPCNIAERPAEVAKKVHHWRTTRQHASITRVYLHGRKEMEDVLRASTFPKVVRIHDISLSL